MAFFYILYSESADLFYIGSTKDLEQRLAYHQEKEFKNSFTAKYSDWQIYFSVSHISISCAKKIELHVKKMKSRVYIENIKKYPAISDKLIERFNET